MCGDEEAVEMEGDRCRKGRGMMQGGDSPVNLWFDLDKIATETFCVGTDSHTHPEQHIKNIEQSK